MPSSIYQNLKAEEQEVVKQKTQDLLGCLIQPAQYVGELYSIGYESALVQIHDRHRMEVGGIPSLCFLVATRLKTTDTIDYTKEDSSIILLRVMDAAPLPNAMEIERIRVEAAQRAAGEATHWDEGQLMDGQTANILSFAGVKCRVIGTFFIDQVLGGTSVDLRLCFGGDISNYYPNRGLKVYKPNSEALVKIVNYRDLGRLTDQPLGKNEVGIGEIRYASTNRSFQGVSDVEVKVSPVDLLDQKTALFGMTRTGKSNTTKIIAKSIFELRFIDKKTGRIGQLILDYNGEYANENVQDASGKGGNPEALKNVWRCNKEGKKEDVITYGTAPHPLDPERRLMKINFYADENIQIGKEIINAALSDQRGVKYFDNFIDVVFERPGSDDRSVLTRYNRAVLAYRTLLTKANLSTRLQANTFGLFGEDLRKALANSLDDSAGMHSLAARVFAIKNPAWAQLVEAFEGLRDFIARGATTGYTAFNQTYVQNSSTQSPWHDQNLLKILEMFHYANGARLIGRVLPQHSPDIDKDYADVIYEDLKQGRLVIIDQSAGEPDVNRGVAERVMWKIFRNNQAQFSGGLTPTRMIIYIEEAHNLLPAGSDLDMQNVWVRTAKEGAKFGIGLVYATQEVSSIQKNILKNTANWFIGHLNNTDETKELCKYYDFEDFEPSIRRAQDKGFLRVKTLSNLFVIPVQINKFEVTYAV